MVGVAFQNDFLYADTIEENIRFGRDISAEDIRWATRIAQAEDFILSFSEGYSYGVSTGGTNRSGGQRQRLTIARALVRKAEILILDDSSSALDYATDAALRAALQNLKENPTVFLISQRTASIQHADIILVLEEGRSIGVGTHEQLLSSCEVYREIYESQFQKGDEEA